MASDLPAAAELSRSSAQIVAMFLAIASANRLDKRDRFVVSIRTLEVLSHYCGCIENGRSFREFPGADGVGTSGGAQDQTAIWCCRVNRISQFGFAPVALERKITCPADVQLVSLNSRVSAEKTGAPQ